MVFYRKYRPQKIADLDSPKLRETLTAVLSSKEIPHAFLFTGPKGLGKTSTARIIAKVLNCTGRPVIASEAKQSDTEKIAASQAPRNDISIEPCNECDQCTSITNGTNIDVLEIDGASNRGIDEIRELRERVNLAPSSAKMKVYIIDEVHMLTTEAFNALLKTIEEPPAHVVFIFATTEPQKVPATIISRCFHVSLNRATKEEIVHALKRIVKEEKLKVEENVLDLIAEMGDGGYRDATKILEEVISVANGRKVDKGFIESYYKTTGVQLSAPNLLAYMVENPRGLTGSLHVIKQIVDQGVDIKYFISEILSYIHRILLAKAQVEGSESIDHFPENLRDYATMQTLYELFSSAYQQTKYAPIPSLPLELAVVQYCQQNSSSVISNDSEKSQGDLSSSTRNDTNRMTVQDVRKKEQNLKVQRVLRGDIAPAAKKPESTAVQTDLPKDIKDVSVLLENLIYKVKSYNHSVAGVLRGCTIRSITSDAITFETAYKFHKEKLEEPKIREILETVVREVTGKNLRVMVELKK